jgi:acid phosphatase type 7
MPTILILSLILSTAPIADEPFSCGPFLLQPGTRTMTVVVDNESAAPARLRYWVAGEEGAHVDEHTEPARHHVFTLESLTPDTAYEYVITSPGLSTGRHTLRTLPQHPERYRVLAMGDVRTHPEDWAKVAGRMFEHEQDALFTIGTGDYPSDGRKYQQWIEQFFAPARSFLGRMPLWPAIGNHERTRRHDDVTQIEQSHYFSLFDLPGNERWYRVDYHLMTLLVLDSNSSLEPAEAQYTWLREQLRSARNRFTVVALHHAPFTSGPHGRLREDGTPAEWPIDQGRRFLVPLCEMYDVDLVLCGHDHLYERSQKDGVVYIVTGGGGAPLYKVDSVANAYQQVAVSTHHYTALDIDESGIDLTAIDTEGQVIDTTRIPTLPRHTGRRTRSLTHAIEQGLSFGPLDRATHRVQVQLYNPLDQPATVDIKSASKGNPIEPLHVSLEPLERREVSLHLEDIGRLLEAEPWRAAIVLNLWIDFVGRDQALDVDLRLKHKATVYSPTYRTQHHAAVAIDGNLSEWTELPAMRADEQTPIVKNKGSYTGGEDFSADVKFAWSDAWLHLSVDVTDESVVDDGTTSLDANDCVRLLLKVASGPAKGLAVHTFGAAGRRESSAEDTGILHTTQSREGGWILEASFPWAALGLDGSENTELSCDLLLVDRDIEDETARPSYHRFWTNSRSRSDTSTYGVLVLED